MRTARIERYVRNDRSNSSETVNRTGATFRPVQIDSYVISADHACAKAENVAKCISPPNLRLVSDIEQVVMARWAACRRRSGS